MGRIVTVVGRTVERTAGLIATPWTAAVGIILFLHWILDAVSSGTRAGSAVQRLDGARSQVDGAALNQTPLVHSVWLLTHTTDQHSYAPVAATADPGRVSLLGYQQWQPAHPAKEPSAPRRRQRRRPSMLAISVALHGGPPR
jgi:hypothetical protein